VTRHPARRIAAPLLHTMRQAATASKETMKKILNQPGDYVDETLDGMCAAYPDAYRRAGEGGRVIACGARV